MALETRIAELEKILHQDPGKRGLQEIWDELKATSQETKMDTLQDAARSLATSCQKAIVVRRKKILFRTIFRRIFRLALTLTL